jgi:tRNA 2-thiouridine synthesizing protein E
LTGNADQRYCRISIIYIDEDNLMSILDSVERTENGYLVNASDWNEEIAAALFAEEGIEPTERHWDIVRYVREETLDGNEPNERGIMKAMSKLWGEKVSSKLMYEMFPLMPSKQGLKIGGCPQSTRKGGY